MRNPVHRPGRLCRPFHCDFVDELRDAGVETDAYGRPDREEARKAWQRLGAEFMSTYNESHTPWAVQQFGEPR